MTLCLRLSYLCCGPARFPPEALTTPDGRPVTVLNPGRRSSGPGPDFRDAIVSIDGAERRGDVELHVRASYFQDHGHLEDPAYAALALHVVYLADEGPETSLFGGGRAPVAALAPWLAQRSQGRAGALALGVGHLGAALPPGGLARRRRGHRWRTAPGRRSSFPRQGASPGRDGR